MAQAAAELPTPHVEGQPLAANLMRLAQALEYLGAPLPAAKLSALKAASAKPDAAELQKLIDAEVLFVVSINPESRVRVARGPGSAKLQQAGYRPAIVKVINQGAITKPLAIHSPAAGAVYGGTYAGSLQREQQLKLRSDVQQAVTGRFLQLEMFTSPPMTDRLSGLEVEYCLAIVYSSEAGRREATISFDVDQGTQDLGFRGETPVLFDIRPAVPVRLRVRDDDGKPTTARLVFRDRAGHIYPPQPKRLNPDLFFQPQIYRADGETVLLAPGEFTMQSSRGPEYRVIEQTIRVPDPTEATVDVQLERWINPMEYGYYSGDHHIHAAGCAHYNSPSEGVLPGEVLRQVKGEGLNVGCILTWGFCYDFQRQFYSPEADKASEPLTVIKYDIEVSGFGSAWLGHVCLLNLKNHVYPGSDGIKAWPTWATPTLRWAKQQGGFTGYPHSGSGMQIEPERASARMLAQYDADKNQGLSVTETREALLPEPFEKIDTNRDGLLTATELAVSHERIAERLPNLGIPEAPLEICAATAHGVCDFTSSMDTARVREWNTWYHLMNCGFPIKCAGETDFPCMSGTRVGQGRTYVQLGNVDRVDFHEWCQRLAEGRSYVSDGYAHAVKFAVDGKAAGETIELARPGKVKVTASVAFASQTPPEVAYGLAMPAAGRPWLGDTVSIHPSQPIAADEAHKRAIELVVNGQVMGRTMVPADDKVHDVQFTAPIKASSWVAVRQFPQLHTNPVIVKVAGASVRASRSSAQWCAAIVEQLIRARMRNIAEAERREAEESFREAIAIYRRIAAESPAGT